MDDGRIVDLLFQRDEAAIENLDIKYGSSLRSLSTRITADEGAAEEIAQDTYMKTWHAVPPTDPRNYLFAFLAKITRNLSLDRVRHSKREKRCAELTIISDELTECIPSAEVADAQVMADELKGLLNQFLAMLKEQDRSIFIFRYFFFKSTAACAKRFGATEAKIKSSLFRARERLKEFLKERSYYV